MTMKKITDVLQSASASPKSVIQRDTTGASFLNGRQNAADDIDDSRGAVSPEVLSIICRITYQHGT